jgi:hypothetical protein
MSLLEHCHAIVGTKAIVGTLATMGTEVIVGTLLQQWELKPLLEYFVAVMGTEVGAHCYNSENGGH